MTGEMYPQCLDTIRRQLADATMGIQAWLLRRYDDGPGPRRAATEAVLAIDTVLVQLHVIRAQLVSETRAYDDAVLAGRPAPVMDPQLLGDTETPWTSSAWRHDPGKGPEGAEG